MFWCCLCVGTIQAAGAVTCPLALLPTQAHWHTVSPLNIFRGIMPPVPLHTIMLPTQCTGTQSLLINISLKYAALFTSFGTFHAS